MISDSDANTIPRFLSGDSLRPGDRVYVRDSLWTVEDVQGLSQNKTYVTLKPLGSGGVLQVIVPPERILPVPTSKLSFDVTAVGPVTPWINSIRALSMGAVRSDELLVGARFGRVALEAYQIAPALRALTKPRPRLLIADDVGLGKTIEAGLCLLELAVRRRADRVLIVVPSGLLDQWKDEMADKFGLEFDVIGNSSDLSRVQSQLPAGVSPWEVLPKIITSIDFIKKDDVKRRALKKRWPLIIVDEAHYLAESGSPANPYRTQRTRLGFDTRAIEIGRAHV